MTISFDKKLAELDAYLQMLIEESETLDKKLESESHSDDERDGLILIKNNLETLLGSIKHAIVLLQIAKVSIKTAPTQTSLQTSSSSITSTSSTNTAVIGSNKSPPAPNSTITAAITASLQEQQRQLQRQRQQQQQQQLDQGSPQPPARSYKKQAAAQQQRHLPSQLSLSAKATSSSVASSASPTALCKVVHTSSISSATGNVDTIAAAAAAAAAATADTAAANNNNEEDDDDDAFYDAADDNQQQQAPKVTASTTKDSPLNSSIEAQDIERSNSNDNSMGPVNMPNNNNNLLEDESIDWDALYEEEEEDLGSLENQGSVIKHLMSQIRIGMDLTKVVLPTFILERRSLLEMYADFFAHPDLFSSIPDHDTPEERIVQLVRWYLSAFHAGRKSAVAKKPYNPIQGEIFLCHWNLNNNDDICVDHTNDTDVANSNNKDELSNSQQQQNIERTDSTESTASIGDIEKFSKQLPQNSLLFIAEQVSHHPPVSAFYAENQEKSISCCAHIYTKSKYLGLSVGVHNLGQGVVNLLKHNETYVCTFPSAYGRSILTVPWVELGGSVNITCEQTGYSASIEFVTKPFYGGKKHRVMGEILRPNKEPFMTIDGEWNGVMYSKSPPNSSEKQVFVDTTCLPVIKKNVRSISAQESFESRNVWKEVTRALKLRDVTSATAAKSFIEQRQRDLLKERMEKGLKWNTRYFETADDGWAFSKPLADRKTETSQQSFK